MTAGEFSAITVADARITARRAVRTAAERVLGRLWIDRLPARLADGDPSLWGLPADAVECRPAQPGPTRDLLPEITDLAAGLRAAGITEVVLVGSGATVRAAEIIVRNTGGALTVLDGLDPGPSARLGADRERLLRTAVVRTDDGPVAGAVLRNLHQMFEQAGLSPDEIAGRCVVVAEHGGPAAKQAAEAGQPVLHAGPHPVFGALSPAALVPAALAGVEVAGILDQATDVLAVLGRPERNPGLVLGAVLGGCARSGRNTVIIGQYPCPLPGLGDWIGRLLSGATEGRLLPVVQDGGLPVLPADDLFLVSLGGRPYQDDATVSGPLVVQLMVWEYAAAVAAHLLGTDPFARSGNEIADAVSGPVGAAPRDSTPVPGTGTVSGAPAPGISAPRTGSSLATGGPEGAAGPAVEVPAEEAVTGFETPAEVLDRLISILPLDGHLSVLAYLDPDESAGQSGPVRRLASMLAARSGRPVTVDWGFVNHSREKGVYLVLTGNVTRDAPVPDGGPTLASLQLTQALAMVRALRERGRPVARLNLVDRRTGMDQLLEAAQGGA